MRSCLLFLALITAAAAVTLVRDGEPTATIVLAEEPTRAAQLAAFELQYHVAEMTGAILPISSAAADAAGPRILVGSSAATAAFGWANDDFGHQEYVVAVRPGALILVGRDLDDRRPLEYGADNPNACRTWPGLFDEQGTLYAVYDFLERCGGVRWFHPAEFGTVIPRRRDLNVEDVDIRRRPFFEFRGGTIASVMAERYDATACLWGWKSDEYAAWEALAFAALHERFPNRGQYIMAKRGLVYLHLLRNRVGGRNVTCNHSLYGYYDRFWKENPQYPDRFEAARPEWFAKDAIRHPKAADRPPQMCYTNPGLVARVAQDAREWFDDGELNGLGWHPGPDHFPVEAMDGGGFCRCADCRPLHEPYAESRKTGFFSRGVHSEYMFSFVDAVAREVATTHPDRWIVTLAYGSHAEPPRTFDLADNVAVQFCFSANRMVYDRPEYAYEVDLLRQWAGQDRPLYLWLYYTFPREVARGWNCFPGFFARSIGEQFRMFRDLGVRGMFHCGYGQEVEAWVTFRLMDDPDHNVDALVTEYFNGLYGPAGPHLRAFYREIEGAYANNDLYPREELGHQTEELAWGFLGTTERMARLANYIAAARAALGDDPALARERRRFELFVTGIWDYMVAGKTKYQERKQAWRRGLPDVRGLAVVDGAPAGDPERVDWTAATPLVAAGGWESLFAEGSYRDIDARLVHDNEYLYLRLHERAAATEAGDRYQILLGPARDYPLTEIEADASGELAVRQRLAEGRTADASLAPVASVHRTAEAWTVYLAVPLAALAADGNVFLNLRRRSATSSDQPAWVPTFGPFINPARLGRVRLGTPPEAGETPPLPVAEWTFDMRGEGAVNGARLAPGPFGNAIELTADKRQYVDCGQDPRFALTEAVSMEAWVRPNPLPKSPVAVYPAIFGQGYEDGSYSLHIRPDYSLFFRLVGEDGDLAILNPRDLQLTPGAWNHVVATWDGETACVYINGRPAGKPQPATGTLQRVDQPLRIGWLGSYHHLDGAVDNVRLYDRALTPGQVWMRYRATHGQLRNWHQTPQQGDH